LRYRFSWLVEGLLVDVCVFDIWFRRVLALCWDRDFCERSGMVLDLQGLVRNGPGLPWRRRSYLQGMGHKRIVCTVYLEVVLLKDTVDVMSSLAFF
jgi:hypothetical protein